MKLFHRTTYIIAASLLAIILSTLIAGNAHSASLRRSPPVKPPGNLVNSGTLTYGTDGTFPPFQYEKGTTLTGFNVDMGKALAKYMGLKTQALVMDFAGLIPALQGGRIDYINAAMYINPDRSKQVDFVPYVKIGEVIMVAKGNPEKIKTLADLSGKTIAVTQGAVDINYVNAENDQLKQQGKPLITALQLPTAADIVVAVLNNRADAFLTSTAGAGYILETESSKLQRAGKPFDLSILAGIAVKKGNAPLKKALKKALALFVKQGKYQKLLKKYDLPPGSSYFPSK